MIKSKAHIATNDTDIDAAIALANTSESYRPKAVSAAYYAQDDAIAIRLATGVKLEIPRALLQGLEHASPEDVARIEIWGPGSSLHWESLDVDHSISSLIEGVFGNRRWMSTLGKRGGAARSEAKARAARKNGRKGGRPRKRIAT